MSTPSRKPESEFTRRSDSESMCMYCYVTVRAGGRASLELEERLAVHAYKYGSAVIMRAALSNGATGYVLKADAGSELLTAIEAAFQGRRFVSSGLAGRIPTD